MDILQCLPVGRRPAPPAPGIRLEPPWSRPELPPGRRLEEPLDNWRPELLPDKEKKNHEIRQNKILSYPLVVYHTGPYF